MTERTITRIVWNFPEGIPVPVLPRQFRWFRAAEPYRLYGVVGELFHQRGHVWFDVHQRLPDGFRRRHYDSEFWHSLFAEQLDGGTFEVLWHDNEHNWKCLDWLCVRFSAINGQRFTDTALDRVVTVFHKLGVTVKTAPLIGKVTQRTDHPYIGRVCWEDVALYQFFNALWRNGLTP